MKIIINGQQFSFHWNHNMEGRKKFTKCYVKRGEEIIGQVESHLHKNDVYVKNKGRIVSLTKALKHLSEQYPDLFTRETRKEIWNTYTEMSPQNWQVNV